MSWYVWYKLGYEDKETGKIHPLGPFDNKGNFKEIFYRSRSFASDLWEEFRDIPEEKVSDELRAAYEKDIENDEIKFEDRHVRYMYLSDLPKGDYIKSGYYLIDDIKQYEESHDTFDIFYDHLTPQEYILRTENELKFGPPKPQKDCDGYEYTPHSMADYAFYMYPEYYSKEYEAFLIRQVADIYDEFHEMKIVVLEEDG